MEASTARVPSYTDVVELHGTDNVVEVSPQAETPNPFRSGDGSPKVGLRVETQSLHPHPTPHGASSILLSNIDHTRVFKECRRILTLVDESHFIGGCMDDRNTQKHETKTISLKEGEFATKPRSHKPPT